MTWYGNQFAKLREREASPYGLEWLGGIQTRALGHFERMGFPSIKNEDWKYTNLAPLSKMELQAGAGESDAEIPDASFLKSLSVSGPCLVFIDGVYSDTFSQTRALPDGVAILPMSRALRERTEQVRSVLGQLAQGREEALTELNTAFMKDGAFVFVPPNVVLEKPIRFIYVSFRKNAMICPRNLVIADEGSRFSMLENYVSSGNEVHFTNAVTELEVRDGARVIHYKFQDENREAFHVSNIIVRQGKDSQFMSHVISVGGALARNQIAVDLNGPGSGCVLNGLFAVTDSQQVDNHTFIDHAKPHCQSLELYKGILDGTSRGVFNGKILVRPGAQGTNARQSSQNLLLSDEASIDTKPGLEIGADDVKCSHGATIGQLDSEALFYLRSRGIDEKSSRLILTRAFAEEMIDKVESEAMQRQGRRLLEKGFGGGFDELH